MTPVDVPIFEYDSVSCKYPIGHTLSTQDLLRRRRYLIYFKSVCL